MALVTAVGRSLRSQQGRRVRFTGRLGLDGENRPPSSGSRSSTEGSRLEVETMAARSILSLGALCREVPTPVLCAPRRQRCPLGGSCRGRRNNLRPRPVIWLAGSD